MVDFEKNQKFIQNIEKHSFWKTHQEFTKHIPLIRELLQAVQDTNELDILSCKEDKPNYVSHPDPNSIPSYLTWNVGYHFPGDKRRKHVLSINFYPYGGALLSMSRCCEIGAYDGYNYIIDESIKQKLRIAYIKAGLNHNGIGFWSKDLSK
jgi:hypothetical protein